MNSINNLYISDVARHVIERYVGKKDYVVRIRVNKKHRVELIVYYEGRKSFQVKGNKLLLDCAYFFAKGNKKFSLPCETEIKCLNSLGFVFKFGRGINGKDSHYNKGYKYRIFVEASSDRASYDSNKNKINEYMEVILQELKNYDNSFIVDDYNENKKVIKSFYTKMSDNTIEYNDLKRLLKVGNENTVNKPGIKKINFNEKLSGIKKDYTEVEFKIIDAIMENRIEAYNSQLSEKSTNEIAENKEKIYQQLLMNKMFDKREREKLLAVDNCPFKDSYAYEMEYYLYAANRANRKKKTQKGRVDNIFINGNKILFTELKYDENVIGGTNGIHKHLIDLINGFEKNDEALSEIYDYVCNYNDVLTCIGGKEEYLIKNVKRFDNSEAEKEFIIICGYSKNNKTKVVGELDRICSLTGKNVGMTESYELILDDQKVNLEEMNVGELTAELKNRYNCETKIYLVDDNYTEFERYFVKNTRI